MCEAHLHLPFTPAHVRRAIDLLSEGLAEFDVPEEDAETVIGGVAAYEAELLAGPEEGEEGGPDEDDDAGEDDDGWGV